MSARRGQATYPRHNWLAAVVPADARRFRVADERLGRTLAAAGAELVDTSPDVEIGPASVIRGEAPYAIVSLEHVLPEGGSRARRALRRAAASRRIRARARSLRPTVRRLGYPWTEVVLWEWEQVLRPAHMTTRNEHLRWAERLPLNALVVGSRHGRPTTILDAALAEAGNSLGVNLRPGFPLVRQGGLVAIADEAVVRVAVGPAAQEIDLLRSALSDLRSVSPPPIVSDRMPWLLASGSYGLAQWTAERRLAGSEPSGPLTETLLGECVEFLVVLHGAGGYAAHASLAERVETIASACEADDAAGLRRVGDRVERALTDVPRGFVHGDFWVQNLLTDAGRLTGVVDWHGAEAGGLPLIDLFHLRLSEVFKRERKYLGTVLVEWLLPWARSGGDDVARAYCRQVGITPTAELLEALVLAYWITRTARELEMYADRVERPVWMRHNVTLVARAISTAGAAGEREW